MNYYMRQYLEENESYFETLYELGKCLIQDELDVAGDCDARRHFHLAVQHAEDGQELRVLDDGEGTVTACAPHCEEEAEAGGRVGGTPSKRGDRLGLGASVRVAESYMALEISSRIFVIGTVNVLGGIASISNQYIGPFE